MATSPFIFCCPLSSLLPSHLYRRKHLPFCVNTVHSYILGWTVTSTRKWLRSPPPSSPKRRVSPSPTTPSFFIVPETGYGPDFPFSGEKMSVTLALYKAANLNDAVDLTVKIQRTSGGSGHSCGIYTQDDASVLSELLECFFFVFSTCKVRFSTFTSSLRSGCFLQCDIPCLYFSS